MVDMEDGSMTPDIDLRVQEVLLAASQHDLTLLQQLIDSYHFPECRAVDVQDTETGSSPLHAAVAACETEEANGQEESNGEVVDRDHDGMAPQEQLVQGAVGTIQLLLENGAIWNQLDQSDETPGCVALRLGLPELYQLMVDAGVRAELLLNRLEGYQPLPDDDEGIAQPVGMEEAVDPNEPGIDTSQAVDSTSYLSSALSLSGDKILDSDQNGVMMAWEGDIMAKSARALIYQPELRVLNIGFGMGIIDTFIQNHANQVHSHHIIEAHPTVLADMEAKGWPERPRVTVHKGKWQDVLPQLFSDGLTFDAIYFDTFAESYSEFRDFFSENVVGLLDQNGKWSFFNGMGADRQISYDVYQKVVEMDLFEAGFHVDWQEIDVPELDVEWEGVKRKYFNIKTYRLPVCRFMD